MKHWIFIIVTTLFALGTFSLGLYLLNVFKGDSWMCLLVVINMVMIAYYGSCKLLTLKYFN